MNFYKDYLFLLSPSEAVKEMITYYKIRAADIIGPYKGMQTTPHVTVSHKEKTKSLPFQHHIELAKIRLNALPPATIYLDGFGFFINGNLMTVYAAIKPTYKTDNWFATVKKQLDAERSYVPHITISKNIPVDDFFKLWREFRLVSYKDSFEANQLLILERKTYGLEPKYDFADTIYFKNELKIV